MASEAPDPSSSELLTDFDIADVDNWDDQNDNSKEIELVKMSSGHQERNDLNSTNNAQINLTSPSHQHSPVFSSMEQFGRLSSNLQHSGSNVGGMFHQPDRLHNFPPEHYSHLSPQPSSTFQETNPSTGHALATLRALAQAQEEQARLIKEQERIKQESQLEFERKMNEQTKANNVDSFEDQEMSSPSPEIPPVQRSIASPITLSGNVKNYENTVKTIVNERSPTTMTSLQAPTGDKKDEIPSKNVTQLKGQIVRTHDQKLMLVTEMGGKKVGYLINPQSGQLPPGLAAQLKSKAGMITEQGQPQKTISTKSTTAEEKLSASTRLNSPKTSPEKDVASSASTPEHPTHVNKTKEEPTPVAMNHTRPMTVIIGENGGPVASVTKSLKNTHLVSGGGTAMVDEKGKKKKGRGKGKKKKDKNEPPKPMSPYLMFFKDIQPTVRLQNPSAGLGEVSRLVSQRWEKVSDEEKKIYHDRNMIAKQEYQIKLAEYRASLPTEPQLTPESPVKDPNGLSVIQSAPIMVQTGSSLNPGGLNADGGVLDRVTLNMDEDDGSNTDGSGLAADHCGSVGERRGSSDDPIVLDSSTETDGNQSQTSIEGEQVVKASRVDLTLSLSPSDSPVYNYVSSKRLQTTSNNDGYVSAEGSPQSSPAQRPTDLDIQNNSNSEDFSSSGKLVSSRPKSSKKSKNSHRDTSGLDSEAKRTKIMKLNSSLVNAEEDIKLLKGKISKKSKKKQKPLQLETLKSPPKLTMKIDIKNSKITESPTKSPSVVDDADNESIADDKGESSEEEDAKPSTQPKALLTFKIPRKQPSSPSEKKGNADSAAKRDGRNAGPRQCAEAKCENTAKITRERGPLYCSNKCLVSQCRSVFQEWVTERKSESGNS